MYASRRAAAAPRASRACRFWQRACRSPSVATAVVCAAHLEHAFGALGVVDNQAGALQDAEARQRPRDARPLQHAFPGAGRDGQLQRVAEAEHATARRRGHPAAAPGHARPPRRPPHRAGRHARDCQHRGRQQQPPQQQPRQAGGPWRRGQALQQLHRRSWTAAAPGVVGSATGSGRSDVGAGTACRS